MPVSAIASKKLLKIKKQSSFTLVFIDEVPMVWSEHNQTNIINMVDMRHCLFVVYLHVFRDTEIDDEYLFSSKKSTILGRKKNKRATPRAKSSFTQIHYIYRT